MTITLGKYPSVACVWFHGSKQLCCQQQLWQQHTERRNIKSRAQLSSVSYEVLVECRGASGNYSAVEPVEALCDPLLSLVLSLERASTSLTNQVEMSGASATILTTLKTDRPLLPFSVEGYSESC